MDVLPDKEELTIQAAIAEFLEGECSAALVRQAEQEPGRYSAELWREFADNGWLQLCLSRENGGEELPLPYLSLLFDAVGYHIAPIPLHGTMVAALVLDRHGGPAHHALLQKVIAGDAILSPAIVERDGGWSVDSVELLAHVEGDDLVLTGEKLFVGNFQAASHCLVVYREAGGAAGLLLVPTHAPAIEHEELLPLAKDGEAIVRFRGVRVPRRNVIGTAENSAAIIEQMMNLSAVLHACLMAGAARRTLDMAVEHAKQREAFGQPIGAFQAIQHMCANMLNAIDGTTLLTREALWRMQEGLPADRQAAQAKSFANEQCLMVCRSAQQIHGGMGFMLEFDLNLWYRRVASWSLRSGTVSEHRRTIANGLLSASSSVRIGSVA
ncbi:hypothetical protein GG851_12955 [Bordetella petrii]|nr:hypothetical protein [Bordetella petrii]